LLPAVSVAPGICIARYHDPRSRHWRHHGHVQHHANSPFEAAVLPSIQTMREVIADSLAPKRF
jgi:hypothetical protein